MDKIRVLQVTGGLGIGGLETVAMNIVRFSDHSKFSFAFLTYSDSVGVYENEAEKMGCKVFHMHKPKNYFLFYRKLKNIINENGPYDVVYSHTFFNSGLVVKAAKACGIKKCISHAHTIERYNGKIISRKVFYSMMRYLLSKYTDYRFACSQAAGEYVYGEKVDFQVIKNGINVELFDFDILARNRIREELGLGDSFVIGNVGRLSEAKNHLFLVKILLELLRFNSNSKLLIVGDGNLRSQIEAEITMLGIRDKVVLTGARSDVPQLLSAIDCFVFPSIHEGLGISAVEAQVSGLNVLCSDTVPHEVQFTDLLVFKSLLDGEKSWAESIVTMPYKGKRENRIPEAKKAGYDIQNSVHEIEEVLMF